MRALILALYLGVGLQAAGVAAQTLANQQFDIRYSSAGLTSLKHFQDVYDTDYVASGRALGDVLIRYRKSGETEWRLAQAAHDPQAEGQRVSFSIGIETITGLAATETFQLEHDALLWTLELGNQTSQPIEIGDLALPLPFNTRYVRDKTETYTKRLIRHSFIGGNGSYIFWMRTNGEGPFLVMTLEKDTRFEYFDSGPDRTFTTYLHSFASQAELAAKGGRWRLPATRAKLSAKGTPGDRARYGFKFRWAMDYEAVRDVLYQEGAFDVNVAPGTTDIVTFTVSTTPPTSGFYVSQTDPDGTTLFFSSNVVDPPLGSLNATPEPGSIALLAGGLGLLAWARRRRTA